MQARKSKGKNSKITANGSIYDFPSLLVYDHPLYRTASVSERGAVTSLLYEFWYTGEIPPEGVVRRSIICNTTLNTYKRIREKVEKIVNDVIPLASDFWKVRQHRRELIKARSEKMNQAAKQAAIDKYLAEGKGETDEPEQGRMSGSNTKLTRYAKPLRIKPKAAGMDVVTLTD